jgi:hypothetical protein
VSSSETDRNVGTVVTGYGGRKIFVVDDTRIGLGPDGEYSTRWIRREGRRRHLELHDRVRFNLDVEGRKCRIHMDTGRRGQFLDAIGFRTGDRILMETDRTTP